ncbi:MAG: YdcF family protein, partial [Reyranella sp.]
EGKSINTIQNMQETRALVGTGHVALVTSGFHMPRALRLARTAGLDAEAFPTDWQILPATTPWWEALMPSAGALGASSIAIREYLAWAFDYRSVAVKP